MDFTNLIDTPSSIYSMHKYWGKKPSNELKTIIKKYSKENDIIFDPFSGFGGIGVEAILLNRNIILNDLNPCANFISENVLNYNVDLTKLKVLFDFVKSQYDDFFREWYYFNGKKIISILRNHSNEPILLKLSEETNSSSYDYLLNKDEQKSFLEHEENYDIKSWYPDNRIISNSRISAKENMHVSDLFPKRALICHSFLFETITALPDCPEKKLLLLAFTANVANCSKLVPPIKTRGAMSPGAWMTGFYIADNYIENNVFHYYENRVKKIIKGKSDFVNLISYKERVGEYTIKNCDAKKIDYNDESFDLIFTDFPYGDTVPYFEQSQIWNCWLELNVDYENEIVISDSKERNKTNEIFARDIATAIAEIDRVLKNDSYFVFTFHSMYGNEWSAIVNALAKTNLVFVESSLMVQKTLSPRQLNRQKTIKGDMLVVFQKKSNIKKCKAQYNSFDLKSYLEKETTKEKLYDTNELIVLCVNKMLEQKIMTDNCDFIKVISCCFEEEEGKWRKKDEL